MSPWLGSAPLAVGGLGIFFNNLAIYRPTLGHISLFAALTHSWSRTKIKDKDQNGITSQRTWVFIDMNHQVQTFCWPLHPPVSWLSLIRAAMYSCVGWEQHKVPQSKSSLLICSISWILRYTLFSHIVTSLELGLVLQSMACHSLINRSLSLLVHEISECFTINGILDPMSTWCFKKLEAPCKNQEIPYKNPLFYVLSGDSEGLIQLGGITPRMTG